MYNQDFKNIYAIMTVKTKSTTIKFKSPQMIIDSDIVLQLGLSNILRICLQEIN